MRVLVVGNGGVMAAKVEKNTIFAKNYRKVRSAKSCIAVREMREQPAMQRIFP